MIRIITHNFLAKLVCLLLAVGVWVYVTSGESKTDNFPGGLPLSLKNTPANLVVVKDVDTINVKISAEKGIWQTLTDKNFEAYIDLSGLGEGVHELPVNVKSDSNGVKIINVNPATVMVRLEPSVTKTVPVEAKIEGNTAEGMIAGEPKFNPEKVDITGAKSYVEKATKATVVIKLNGESEKFDKNLPLVAYDSQDRLIKDISFKPSEVEVSLPIIKGGNTKTVGIVAKTSGSPQSGYWVSQVSVNPAVVVITGTSTILGKTDYLETRSINIDGVTSEKKQFVSLSVPSGITLLDEKQAQVEVTISITTISSQKEVTASLNYQNLANNLSISSTDPTSVKVLISGSSDKLQSLDSSKVILNLDLAKYTSAGTFAIDISKNNVTLPDGLQIISVVPSSIRLTLGNK